MTRLYTREELAAEVLRVSVRQVDRYRLLGWLKPTRLGRSVRFTQDAVDDLLQILNPPPRRVGGRPRKAS